MRPTWPRLRLFVLSGSLEASTGPAMRFELIRAVARWTKPRRRPSSLTNLWTGAGTGRKEGWISFGTDSQPSCQPRAGRRPRETGSSRSGLLVASKGESAAFSCVAQASGRPASYDQCPMGSRSTFPGRAAACPSTTSADLRRCWVNCDIRSSALHCFEPDTGRPHPAARD